MVGIVGKHPQTGYNLSYNGSMWRLVVAVAFLIAGLVSLITSRNVPNVFTTPVQQSYSGEIIENLQIEIPVDGTYEVGLQVSRNPGEPVQSPSDFPLNVTVRKGNSQVGSPTTGSASSAERVLFVCYEFKSLKGETVHLSARPGKSLGAYKERTQKLVVSRVPFEYVAYFLNVYGRMLAGIVGVLSALIVFLSYRRFISSKSQHQNSGSFEP